MEAWFLGGGIALCLFSLWAIARHDWVRITRPAQRVQARVSGHRTSWENSSKSYAAIYSFTTGTAPVEVIDPVHSSSPRPAVGEVVELVYPEGRPDLARPPRPLLWLLVYALLLFLLGILVAKAMGWLPDSGGDIPG